MEAVIQRCSQQKGSIFSTCISDVGAGEATLYVLNGGMNPPNPVVGDFSYDFSDRTISVYFPNEWKNITVTEVDSRLRHPMGFNSVVSFTRKGLPYWMPAGQDHGKSLSPFPSVDKLLDKFVASFDCTRIVVQTERNDSEVLKRKLVEEISPGEEGTVGRKKRACCSSHSSLTVGATNEKDPSRFVKSLVGFPKDSQKLRWDAGFETYMPFSGKRYKKEKDEEKQLVAALAGCPSSERSNPEPCDALSRSFSIRDLVVELELHPAIRRPREHGETAMEDAWTELVNQVNGFLQKSTSVVVRGWAPEHRTKLTKESLCNRFGDLGQECQWVDGTLYAQARKSKRKNPEYHQVTTLGRFVDLVEDKTVCGNFLDGKDVKPNHPFWVSPILDSITAWNQTMRLKATQTAAKGLVTNITGPSFINAAIWNSQGWGLLTHAGFVTYVHHDCCGMDTLVVAEDGAKIWAVIRPKQEKCPSSISELRKVLDEATKLSKDSSFPNADVATVCLEEGDVMFQPPGVLHAVYTPVPSVFSGAYFFSYATMAQTRAVLSLLKVNQKGSLTNDERPGFMRTLSRMLIALKYRSKPRKITKKNLLSLLLIILDSEMSNPGPEERGEVALASEYAKSVLKWLNMTLDEARDFVDKEEGPYYSGGEEVVEIPALEGGATDHIFSSTATGS